MAITRQLRNTLSTWRLLLGNDLASRGTALTDGELTSTVDRTIERCLALRLCEDRGVLPAGTLARLAEGSENAARFAVLNRRLFGPPGTDGPTAVRCGDAALQTILGALATPHQASLLTALPLEALSGVRELFHDRPLRVGSDRNTVQEERTGTRKAGGVYYTPAPLVEYLVRQTLGPLLAVETPDSLRGFTVLDPACGAGAFLLGAYRFLLSWHRDRYHADPRRYADKLTPADDGTWQITADERRRILRDHIYGVDREPRAIETTRLTLLIQCYDGPPGGADAPSPELGDNLRLGDALIGPDIYHDPAMRGLSAEECAALLPLDWQATFPAIGGRGGFDVVIGNPPYLSYSGRQAIAVPAPVRRYLRERYGRAGWPAAHTFFIERAVTGLARRRIAFVVPDQVGHLAGYAPTRALLTGVTEVRYWGERVFADATTPILTFIADKGYCGSTTIIEPDGHASTLHHATGQPWRGATDTALLDKLYRDSESLGALVNDVGVHTGNCSRMLIVPSGGATTEAVPILEGKDIGRYRCAAPDRALRRDYAPRPGEYFTLRAEGRYTAAPFLIRQTAPHPIVGPRRHAHYFRNSLLALYPPSDGRAIEYLVGILNSRLCFYVYKAVIREARQRTFPQVKIGTLRRLPIRRLDLPDADDRAQHDSIATAVRQLLTLHERHNATVGTAAREGIAGEIEELDRHLDTLIYALYELSETEIATIEAQPRC